LICINIGTLCKVSNYTHTQPATHSIDAQEVSMKYSAIIFNGTLSGLCLGLFLATPAIPAAAADVATLTAPCEDCHGKDGASTESKIPIIGGMSSIYISDSLAAYRDKTRPCTDVKYPAGEHKGDTSNMCKVAEKLSEADATVIGDHFADKPFARAKQDSDAGLAEKGKAYHAVNCKKCHEDGGSSPDDDAGILAGQWVPYLEEQFKDYQEGKRVMPEKMKPKFEKLTEDDVKALLNYYASFK
jgi:sulfide dehydrogenase cytochrome subunit